MNIYYITNVRIPTEKAHGYQIAKMCEEFGKLGNKVTLISSFRKNYIKENIFDYYSIGKTFEIKEIGSLDFMPMEKILGRTAFILHRFFFFFKLFFITFEKGAIIYTRDMEVAFLFSRRGYKTIYEAHNFGEWASFYRFLLKKVFLIVSITFGLKRKMVEDGFEEKKIEIFPDGVDLKKFQEARDESQIIKDKFGIKEKEKIAMYAGSLQKWKGVDVLIKSISNFQFLTSKKEESKVKLMIVGGGGEKKELEKLVGELDLKNEVIFAGLAGKKEIPSYMMAADLLVLPNSGKEEISRTFTSPLKMFEYMASGKPIVAADLSSIREILNEETAFLFKADDAADLADKIKRVLENEEEAKKRAERALKEVEKYDWKNRAEAILEKIKK
ncbi:MAG: glycosyltransferase [Candidatus Paceibacterota bacterium]